jgi:hypothetical protein
MNFTSSKVRRLPSRLSSSLLLDAPCREGAPSGFHAAPQPSGGGGQRSLVRERNVINHKQDLSVQACVMNAACVSLMTI